MTSPSDGVNAAMEGFAQAATGAAAAARTQLGIRQQVDAGMLSMEPGTAEKVAAAYTKMADGLLEDARNASLLAEPVNFGQCNEGQALSNKFATKADGAPNSAVDVIRAYEKIYRNMAETVLEAGRRYSQTDEGNRAAFDRKH